MVTTAILFVLLGVASVTDLRWGMIFNWTTYPGILLALAGNLAATLAGIDLATSHDATRLGMVGIEQSLTALLLCGGIMLVCYVFFAGGVGGGDIKLIAMIGAFLGVEQGVTAMLWTLVLGGCFALITLIWKDGAVTLLASCARYVWFVLSTGTRDPLGREQRGRLETQLYLAPSAVAAVIIVRLRLIELF
jgi:prepilin peptidase CpaA